MTQTDTSRARVIDGKAVAARVREEVRVRVQGLKARGVEPGLATVLVGDDPASAIYVGSKEKICREIGMASFGFRLPSTTSREELLALVDELNRRDDVHGILVQLPLPAGLDANEVIDRIDPAKDVDGLHPTSQGRLMAGSPGLRPCTPSGVMRLVDETGVDPKGLHAVVVGRSLLVGKPVALMLLERHATVTICHTRTRELAAEVARGDVVVAAAGKPGAVRGDWIKPGAIVIDVGTNRTDAGLVGDVEFEAACRRAAWITPVPGGVGPMTIAMLMSNTAEAASRRAR
ncbi:MAG: bifunctional methylenetetrahydrofolate dehydrogenase/methenyltetrahydrofolate cyclohydrolase FolD [Alphaproteobacteria bacterium]